MKDLPRLLKALDPAAELADRHIWLIKLFEWIRGDKTSTQASVARVQAFIEAVQKQTELQTRLQAWWETLIQTVDITPLLAAFGFAPRTAFVSELAERLRRKLLPGTPETQDAAELFPLVVPTRFDAQWMSALEESHITQLTALLSANPARDRRRWHYSLMDALTYCTAQIRATAFAPELRLRMNRASPHARAFHALPADVQGCESFVLARQPVIAVLPESHRLSSAGSLSLSDLAHDTLLQPDDPPGLSLAHTLRQLMATAGFTPQRTMVVNEMSSTIGLVAAGLGVALLPASARVMRLPGVAFCTLNDVHAVSELIVVHRRFERSAAVRALLERLRLARETQP